MDDLKKLKVAELKELLSARSLSTTGKKDELLARLEEATAGEGATGASTAPAPATASAPAPAAVPAPAPASVPVSDPKPAAASAPAASSDDAPGAQLPCSALPAGAARDLGPL
jgi:hypothetical protein